MRFALSVRFDWLPPIESERMVRTHVPTIDRSWIARNVVGGGGSRLNLPPRSRGSDAS